MELKGSVPPVILTVGVILDALDWTEYCEKLPIMISADRRENPGPCDILETGNVPPGAREALLSSYP
jgi:hypothetical protein